MFHFFKDPSDPQSHIVINDPTANGYTKEGLQLHEGAVYVTLVNAHNRAKLVASHETTGVKIDTTPPVVS